MDREGKQSMFNRRSIIISIILFFLLLVQDVSPKMMTTWYKGATITTSYDDLFIGARGYGSSLMLVLYPVVNYFFSGDIIDTDKLTTNKDKIKIFILCLCDVTAECLFQYSVMRAGPALPAMLLETRLFIGPIVWYIVKKSRLSKPDMVCIPLVFISNIIVFMIRRNDGHKEEVIVILLCIFSSLFYVTRDTMLNFLDLELHWKRMIVCDLMIRAIVTVILSIAGQSVWQLHTGRSHVAGYILGTVLSLVTLFALGAMVELVVKHGILTATIIVNVSSPFILLATCSFTPVGWNPPSAMSFVGYAGSCLLCISGMAIKHYLEYREQTKGFIPISTRYSILLDD